MENDKTLDEPPEVAVVIPAYRATNTIGKVLEGLQDQKHGNFSVIIVDDSPKNRCQMEVEERRGDLELQYLQNEENSGLAYSLNRGIRESESEYVVTLHDDCVPLSEMWLSKLVQTMEENVEAVAAKSRFLLDFNEMSKINIAFAYVYDVGEHIDTIPKKEFEEVDHLETKCDIYRREVFQEIGYFQEHILSNEDTEFSHRLLDNGHTLLKDNRVAVEHILEENERQGSITSHLSKGYIYTKHAAYPFFEYGMNYKLDSLFAVIMVFFVFLPSLTAVIWSVFSAFFHRRFFIYSFPLTMMAFVFGIQYAAAFIGVGFLFLKGAVRALRYSMQFGKIDLLLPIILFSFLWEISAAIGWTAGIKEAVTSQ